ncbi:vomeronasal type-2 receptor 116-like [Microtus pennsylvanicus]|uniref:vomeronasal type-2 receptor 116-like n=1 Tax=Microtus pennsylvanicus TaxID=10058 RepID=UPI003F6D0B9C
MVAAGGRGRITVQAAVLQHRGGSEASNHSREVRISAPPCGTAVNRGRICCQTKLFWFKMGCSRHFSGGLKYIKCFQREKFRFLNIAGRHSRVTADDLASRCGPCRARRGREGRAALGTAQPLVTGEPIFGSSTWRGFICTRANYGPDFLEKGGEGAPQPPWLLHPFLKDKQFTNHAGEQVNLNEKMKLNAEYDILNYWNFPEGLGLKVKVGQFSPYGPLGQQLSLSEDMIEWATGITETPQSICSESCSPGFRKSLPEGNVACCFDCTLCPENEISNETDADQCVKCLDHQYANTDRNHCLQKSTTFLDYDDPLGRGLSCIALYFSALSALVLGIFLKQQDTPIVKANNCTLSYILLITLNCCFLCSFLFIGHPNTTICILQQTTFGVLFTVAVSTVLAKTITVILAYKVTAPGRRIRWLLVTRAPNFIVPICTLFQIILCGVWLGKSPLFIDTDAHSEREHIIILCNKGSVTAFYCVLGYLGALALGSFTVAFLARNLPDTFNEAKFLTFSMLVFCSVWVTFLPVYHSTKGKVMVAVEVFSILASSAGLLGCIFAPKCYIILFRPQMNSIQGLRNKIHYRYKA